MSEIRNIILQSSETNCSACGRKLWKQKTQKGKARQLNRETIYWYDWVLTCGNKACNNHLKSIYAAERLTLKMPKAQFTVEAILKIESESQQTKMSVIAEKYQLPLRLVYRLKHQAQSFLAACQDPEELQQRILIEQQGKYHLIIDGTSGKSSKRHLYPCYDGISGKLIYNKSLKGNTASDIKEMLKDLEQLYGIPEVVSMDRGSSLVKAVYEEWPDIPIQYDHYHFLKNLGSKLFQDENKQLKERIQTIEQSFQKKTQALPEKEKKTRTSPSGIEVCFQIPSTI